MRLKDGSVGSVLSEECRPVTLGAVGHRRPFFGSPNCFPRSFKAAVAGEATRGVSSPRVRLSFSARGQHAKIYAYLFSLFTRRTSCSQKSVRGAKIQFAKILFEILLFHLRRRCPCDGFVFLRRRRKQGAGTGQSAFWKCTCGVDPV